MFECELPAIIKVTVQQAARSPEDEEVCAADKWGVRVCVCVPVCAHGVGTGLSSLIRAVPKGAFLSEAGAGRDETLGGLSSG